MEQDCCVKFNADGGNISSVMDVLTLDDIKVLSHGCIAANYIPIVLKLRKMCKTLDTGVLNVIIVFMN